MSLFNRSHQDELPFVGRYRDRLGHHLRIATSLGSSRFHCRLTSLGGFLMWEEVR